MEENKGTIRNYIGEIIIKDAIFNTFDIISECLINKGIDVDVEPVKSNHILPNSVNCKIKMYNK